MIHFTAFVTHVQYWKKEKKRKVMDSKLRHTREKKLFSQSMFCECENWKFMSKIVYKSHQITYFKFSN